MFFFVVIVVEINNQFLKSPVYGISKCNYWEILPIKNVYVELFKYLVGGKFVCTYLKIKFT